jgi:hypothetical protein
MSASHDVSWCHMSVSSLCFGPTCQPFLFDSRAALPCTGNRCTTWLCLEPFLAALYINAYPLTMPLLPPYSSLSSPFSLQRSSTSGSHSFATTKLWRPATSLLPRLNRAKNRPRLSPWQLPRSTASPGFASPSPEFGWSTTTSSPSRWELAPRDIFPLAPNCLNPHLLLPLTDM